MLNNPYDAAGEAAASLEARLGPAPRLCVVLGSGLGALAGQLEDAQRVPYGEIPHFPRPKVAGHSGELILGKIRDGGPTVVALAGRVHLYEGHDLNSVCHPLRSLSRWGVEAALISNAAGGIHHTSSPGDLMLITDHMNMTGSNPLCGANDERMGTRFPDMSNAYDAELRAELHRAAVETGVSLREGVYAGLLGPSYETPAEVRMLRTIGADAVGMSTVCEVIAAHHIGMKTVGISVITNLAAGVADHPLDHSEVKETADRARVRFIKLVERGLARMDTLLAGASA